jgi:hypothetical protein
MTVMSLRISDEERRVIRAVAERLGRTEPDTLRTMVKALAKELGVSPQPQDGKQDVAEVAGNRAS